MQSQVKRLMRHLLVLLLFGLAAIGGFVPFFPGVVFFIVAIVILSVDYRIIRDLVLRPIRRRLPNFVNWASRERRRFRFRFISSRKQIPPPPPDTTSPTPDPPDFPAEKDRTHPAP